MNIIEPGSALSIVMDYTLSDTDHSVLSLLYLPIIKGDAYLVYQILAHRSSLSKEEGLLFHEELLSDLGIESAAFLRARQKLEAIGLLETYRKESSAEGSVRVLYLYRLLPPANPKKFFSDIVLRNLLLQNVSRKKYHRLVSYFRTFDEAGLQDFDNVSDKFSDVYSVNLSDEEVTESDNIENKQYKEISKFDSAQFEDYLVGAGISPEKVKPYLAEIADLSKLYGIGEKEAFSLFEDSLDSSLTFYIDKFRKLVRQQHRYQREESFETEKASLGQGSASKAVRLFTSTTPKEYLQAFFHAEPSSFMLEEIEKLQKDFGFDNGIINVILDYSLKKTGKEFNTILIDKVAYSLSANEVKDCYDAIVKLKTRDFVVKNHTSKTGKAKPKTEKPLPKEEENEITQEDFNKMLGDFKL